MVRFPMSQIEVHTPVRETSVLQTYRCTCIKRVSTKSIITGSDAPSHALHEVLEGGAVRVGGARAAVVVTHLTAEGGDRVWDG